MNSSFLRQIFWAKLHPFVGAVFLLFVALSSGVMITYSSHFLDLSVVEGWQSMPSRGAVLGVSTPETVVWTNLKNVIAETGDLEQTAGNCQGCADAGANSTQRITSGDGYFEFTTATDPYYYVYAGLSNDTSAATSAIMPFTFEISGGYVSVRENGVYKSDTRFVSGDVFRVSVESGKVKYYKNGVSFYTSSATPSYPLVADVSMQSIGSKLWSGKIATSSDVVVSSPPVVTPPPAITPPPTVTPPPPTVNTGAPVISAVTVTNVAASSAYVNWVTDISSDSVVNYGTSTKYGKTVQSSSLVTNHRLSLTGLRAKTQYHFRVRSKANNLAATSGDFVFTTPSTTVTATNTKPTGALDGVSTSGTVFGWAQDADDLSKAISVHLYFDINAGAAGASPISCLAGDFRADVGNHAFNCSVPSQYQNGSQHQVWAWGVDLSDPVNNNTQLTGSLKTFILGSAPAPAPALPVISSFTSTPSSITAGQSATLSWTASGANTISIDQGVGDVAGLASKTVTPTTTTTYTLTASNATGIVTKTFTVNVGAVVATPSTVSAVELPRVYVNSSYPSIPAASVSRFVKSSCGGVSNCFTDFQAALNAAVPGDQIIIDAGLNLVAPSGGFVLPAKSNSGNQWIIIRTANLSSIPSEGGRISPSYASQMPKILAPDNLPAMITAAKASYYRFVGVEISAVSGVTSSSGLVMLGSYSETNVANQPHHIIFDRTYVHGLANQNTRRGFFLNSGETAIVDSYLSTFQDNGADAQAILGDNGPGPLKVLNNYLEASGENFMIGGIDAVISGMQMSDVEIRGNYITKPLSWRGGPWVIKNLLELKNGQRILISGNILENSWAAAQSGMAMNIKTVNQDGGMTWAETKNVTVINNIIRHAAVGIGVTDRDNNGPSGSTNNVFVSNNLFDDISATRWGNGSGGTFVQSLGATNNVTFSHNTALNDGNTIVVDSLPAHNFIFKDNISSLGGYGIKGSGMASGNGTIATYFPGSTFAKNVMIGDGTNYPTNNFYPTTASSVGFVNYNGGVGGDYSLGSSSTYKNAATDSKDVGVDMTAVLSSTSCSLSGGCSAGASPPAVALPVTTSFLATPSSITTGQSSTLYWAGTGATSLSVSPGVGLVTGTSSVVVSPTTTTTYTLTATNSAGSVTTNATITVSASSF